MDKGYTIPTARSRELRLNATAPERKLWQAISGRQLEGVRFNRQFPIGPYICDFVSRSARLVIEVDGETHAYSVSRDLDRTRFLEKQGYVMLRFWNKDIMENLEGVLRQISLELANTPSPKREGSLWGQTIRWTQKS